MLPTKLTSAARLGSMPGVLSAVVGACSDATEVELMTFLPVCDVGGDALAGRAAMRELFAFGCRNVGFDP